MADARSQVRGARLGPVAPPAFGVRRATQAAQSGGSQIVT